MNRASLRVAAALTSVASLVLASDIGPAAFALAEPPPVAFARAGHSAAASAHAAPALHAQRVALDFHTNALAGMRGTWGAADPISGTLAFALPKAAESQTVVAFYRLADGTPIAHAAVPGCGAATQPARRLEWIGTAVSIAAEPEARAFVVACSREADSAIRTTLVAFDATSHAVIARTVLTNQGYPQYVPDLLLLGGASTTDVITNGTVALDPRTLAPVPTTGTGIFEASGSTYVERGDRTFANLGPAPLPSGKIELPFPGDPAFALMPWLRETVYADGRSLRFQKLGESGERDTHLAGSPSYFVDVDDARRETFALGVGTARDDRERPAEEVDAIGDDGRVGSVATLPRGVIVRKDAGPIVIDADGTLVVAATDRIVVLDRARTHVVRTIAFAESAPFDSLATTFGLPGHAAIARATETDFVVEPVRTPAAHVKTIALPASR